MRSLAGLDLNGLWDWAAVVDAETDSVVAKDAGINGSIIRLHCDTVLVAGIQAGLAPHGRGQGWGALGDPGLRFFVAEGLTEILGPGGTAAGRPEDQPALVALIDDLARDAATAVMAVSDVPEVDEAARHRLLEVLDDSHVPQVSLLWRPIAAILGWLIGEPAADGRDLREGLSVAVVSLLRDGVEIGDARLVAHETPEGCLWVPERVRAGLRLGPESGAGRVAERIAEAAAGPLAMRTDDVLASSMAPWRLAVGEAAGADLIRMPNRSWRQMPALGDVPTVVGGFVGDPAACQRLKAADVILVEGPAVRNRRWASEVLAAFGIGPADLRLAFGDVDLVARGCLHAGQRMDGGHPPYFDFLPQLEINALVGDTPAFVPLIPSGTRLRGGEPYVGRADATFEIGAGATSLTFYLLKEDFRKPRKAEEPLPEAADRPHRIDVTVEQWPGQGFARVRIASDSFAPLRARPIDLDWSRMTIVDGDRETILHDLASQRRIAYPDLRVIPGHAVHWHPEHPRGDICAQLRAYVDRDLFRGDSIAAEAVAALQCLRERADKSSFVESDARHLGLTDAIRESRRFINSDGRLPEQLMDLAVPPQGAEELLDRALGKAADEFDMLVQRFGADADRAVAAHLIGFATWCYWRCPKRIIGHLLDIYADTIPVKVHPILLVEGLGRTVHENADVGRFLRLVDDRLQREGSLRNMEYAALGRVLGGCPGAAELLEPAAAHRFLQETCRLIEAENDKNRTNAYKRKFKFAMLMLAVLLRHRCRNPNFLDPGNSRAATVLLKLLGMAEQRMTRFAAEFTAQAKRVRGKQTQAQQYANARQRLVRTAGIVCELVRFINLEGRDPNIIRKIEDMD